MSGQGNDIHTWRVYSQVLVSFTKAGKIPNEVWDAYIAALSSPSVKSSLALTVGSVDVNSVQRKQVSEVVTNPKSQLLCVVVTDNPLTRGIATAVSWFGANLKAFSWRDLERALESLGVNAKEAEIIQKDAQSFLAKAGGSAS
jgi:hypothetical protein